jgi:hypothetical protein
LLLFELPSEKLTFRAFVSEFSVEDQWLPVPQIDRSANSLPA